MDNAPFDGGDNSADEVVRILYGLADRIHAEGSFADSLIADVNGNTIGSWAVEDDEEHDGLTSYMDES